jgi:hypothetical protein
MTDKAQGSLVEPWMIFFEDADVRPEIYDTEAAARVAYERANLSWSCHLYAPAAEIERLTAELRDERLRRQAAEVNAKDFAHEADSARAELAALRREGQDAARYKWLRDNGAAIDPDSLHWKRNKWLDAAIDAALAAAPEDGPKSGG